jgi:hypothetical protein
MTFVRFFLKIYTVLQYLFFKLPKKTIDRDKNKILRRFFHNTIAQKWSRDRIFKE